MHFSLIGTDNSQNFHAVNNFMKYKKNNQKYKYSKINIIPADSDINSWIV